MRIRKKTRGVTLIELCFGLAIVAILAGLAAPTFRADLRASAVRSAAYELLSGLQQARASSIVEGRTGVFCLSDAAGNCLPNGADAAGWQVSLEVDGHLEMRAAHTLPPGVALRSSRARLSFWPDSLGSSTGTLTICDRQAGDRQAGDMQAGGLHPAAQPRAIVVSQGGRARLARGVDAACR